MSTIPIDPTTKEIQGLEPKASSEYEPGTDEYIHARARELVDKHFEREIVSGQIVTKGYYSREEEFVHISVENPYNPNLIYCIQSTRTITYTEAEIFIRQYNRGGDIQEELDTMIEILEPTIGVI